MTKRNIQSIIIAIVTLCVSLSAFEIELEAAEVDYQLRTFTVVAEGYIYTDTHINPIYQIIMYDPDTMVMYTYFIEDRSATMSVLYNADGTLKTYSPNTKYVTFTIVEEVQMNRFSQIIMYDPDTMVLYTYLIGTGRYQGAMSIVYNADGTLKTYTPE